MRRILSALLLLTILSLSARSQDMKQIRDQGAKDEVDFKTYPYGNNKAAGKYFNIRGIKMYCEVYGEGQPLLFIHGNGGSIRSFLYQIGYFSQHYKVIVADSRNQGKSYDNSDSLTYEMMADDYSALLDSLKTGPAYVVGWSDGGIEGLLLAIRHPEKVKKLAVTGANLVPDSSAVPQEIWDMVMPEYNQLKAKPNLSIPEKRGLKLLRLLVEQPHIPLSDLHKISCPTLVIGGDYDVIKTEHTMLIAKNISQSYLWILPGSGHSTPVVYKDEFNKKVDQFFSSDYRKIEKEDRFF